MAVGSWVGKSKWPVGLLTCCAYLLLKDHLSEDGSPEFSLRAH